MKEISNLEIYNETKWQIKNLPFLQLKNKILGKGFALSLSILLPKNSKKVNQKMRNKSYTPNILSFKYTAKSGEIILTPAIVEKEEYFLRNLQVRKFENKMIYLFIHSALHLKNLDHSPKMDNLEWKYFKAFVV